ncbi:MAG: hypothetical protein GF372_14210 [Candidatus Marinimicrobia bacterium]|nr:hypothetical protein [Candidatus Neomarinimicrobiota bacterium]
MKAKRSHLQLNSYSLFEFLFNVNTDYDDELNLKSLIISPDLDFHWSKVENNSFLCALKIRIDDESIENEGTVTPYKITMDIAGIFYFEGVEYDEVDNFTQEEDGKEIDLRDFKYTNAPAMLYGIARSKISQITAESMYGEFIIPSVNLIKTFASDLNDRKDEIAEDSGE